MGILYVVYEYWDYWKEFPSKILRVYENEVKAAEFTESFCVSEEKDKGIEYVDIYEHSPSKNPDIIFDRKDKKSDHGRIGVAETLFFSD